MKIEKLTKEQEGQFPVYVKKWLDIGLSTEPANKELAELAVRQAYEIGGKKHPEKFTWCDSPLSMVIVDTILQDAKLLGKASSVWSSVASSVASSVEQRVEQRGEQRVEQRGEQRAEQRAEQRGEQRGEQRAWSARCWLAFLL